MPPRKQLLDVYLRTHIGANVHAGTRFVPFDKATLVQGCVSSLIAALSYASESADITLTLIDDHSESPVIDELLTLARKAGIAARLVRLPQGETGNSASFRATYRIARETARELIYFVEDDYLHLKSAVTEMLEAHALFSENLRGAAVGIFPVDYPDYYNRLMEETRIVLGSRRHFRTVRHSTGTFLVSRTLFLKHWDKFAAFGLYGLLPEVTEHSTINRIWFEGAAFLFSPLSSLALHMQFKENLPPYVKWEEWWQRCALPGTD